MNPNTSKLMLLKKSWLLVALLFAASWLPVSVAEAPRYLAAGAEHAIDVLPVPPTDDSIAGRADLETVLQVQADRTPAQVARAKAIAKHTPFTMGAHVFGPWFTAENLPKTAAILEQTRKEYRPVLVAAKAKWQRVRPFNRDPHVKPCVELPKDASYPSGHSANAAIWGAVFSAAFPEKAAEFSAFVHETMWSRVLGGVHYPTDTQGGYLIGSELGRRLLETPAMQDAVRQIREEVLAVQARATLQPTAAR